jgi:hypothetical protein
MNAKVHERLSGIDALSPWERDRVRVQSMIAENVAKLLEAA